MEFDWLDTHFDLKKMPPSEISEAFEDPFAIRLLPDTDGANDGEPRYFALGKTVTNRYVFSVFWTDGKNYRVILARDMTDTEKNFYDRKNAG